MPTLRILSVVLDCAEPERLARFWRELVGGEIDERTRSTDWVALRDVPSIGHLGFQQVPEQKAVKNRVHIDLETEDIGRSILDAVALGAESVGVVIDEGTNLLQVMRDPEGNEFCLIQRRVAP